MNTIKKPMNAFFLFRCDPKIREMAAEENGKIE